MSGVDIVRRHTVRHRDGTASDVVLRPYLKNGAYRVVRSGEGNRTDAEIACQSLEQVAAYVRPGFLIRMKAAVGRIEGLYSTDGVEVIC